MVKLIFFIFVLVFISFSALFLFNIYQLTHINSNEEVIDKTCEVNFARMKKDLRPLIYTACEEKHQFCNYLPTN